MTREAFNFVFGWFFTLEGVIFALTVIVGLVLYGLLQNE